MNNTLLTEKDQITTDIKKVLDTIDIIMTDKEIGEVKNQYIQYMNTITNNDGLSKSLIIEIIIFQVLYHTSRC